MLVMIITVYLHEYQLGMLNITIISDSIIVNSTTSMVTSIASISYICCYYAS